MTYLRKYKLLTKQLFSSCFLSLARCGKLEEENGVGVDKTWPVSHGRDRKSVV